MLTVVHTTVGDALDQAADRWADREGWVIEDRHITFAALRHDANRAAKALIALGFLPGDVVATWMPNRPEWLVLQMACAKTGVILTGLNTRFKVEEVRYVLERSDVRALVFAPPFLGVDFIALLEESFPGARDQLAVGTRDLRLRKLQLLIEVEGRGPPHCTPFEAFLAMGDGVNDQARQERQRARRPDEAVLMKFTSGSTGLPKGVLVHHLEALYWGASIYDAMGVTQSDTVLNTQPFYHAGGSCGALPAPLSLGCRVVTAEFYEPERIMRLIERERCTARSGSAAMYLTELEHPRFQHYDRSSLKAAWCVGTPAVFERIRRDYGLENIFQPFGATEAGGTCSRVGDAWATRTSTCGKPFAGTELRIVDTVSQQSAAPGQVGEISFRGWWAMLGYYQQPSATRETKNPEGWVRTGDLGFIDSDGNLHCVGRLKDTIRPGGESTSAREIEAYLLTHPAIQQVAVFGIPDARLGEVVMAVIETKKQARMSAEEVVNFCRGKIASYKVPRQVQFTQEWPMTGSGKIQKYVLRQAYLESTGSSQPPTNVIEG